MWQEHEMDAWLGPAGEDMTDEQRDQFAALAEAVFAQWPAGEDDPAAGTEQLNGALMVVLGDATLAELGAVRRQAELAYEEAHGRVLGAILASRELGPSEISRQSGLSRVTVTKVLQG